MAPIDKTRENQLRWFGHVQCKTIDVLVRSDNIVVNGAARNRGRSRRSVKEG